MNASLLTASLLNPTLAAGASWAAAAGAGESSSGPAFARALDGARQSASPLIEPARAPTPPAREPEGAGRGEAASAPRPAAAPERERAARDESGNAGERAPRSGATTRPAEPVRRPAPQANSRRDAASAKAEAPATPVKGHPAEDGESDTLLPGRSRGLRATDAAETGPAIAAVAAEATATPADPSADAAVPTVALARGAAAPTTEGAGGDGEALALGLRATARGAAAALDTHAAESDPGTGTRATGATARRASGDPASAGTIDVGALGLHAVRAEAGRTPPVASEGGRAGDGPGVSAAGTSALPTQWGAFAAALAPAGPAASAAAGSVREAGLSAAPGSEAFARELGTQVSIFVREGVQQARLHLNPQELGPVLVRIQLEGQAAQVHLAAEQQPTRQALEQALPALASQLSEAGITLTGGGVFERPPQGSAEREARGGERPGSAGFGPGAADRAGAATTVGEPGRWSRPRGLVDLIA